MERQLLKRLMQLSLVVFASILFGCLDKHPYDPDKDPTRVRPSDEYFDFSMYSDVKLNVNYNGPQYKVLIEVYGENPLKLEGNAYVKRTDVEALFKAYTDDRGSYSGVMTDFPAAVEKVYLFTRGIGFPECVELPVVDKSVTYTGKTQTLAMTKSVATRAYNYGPYLLDAAKNYYSICQWNAGGKLDGSYAEFKPELTGYGQLPGMLYRVLFDNIVRNQHNANLVIPSEKMNLYVDPADPSQKVKLDFVFAGKAGEFSNSFGYYYYKGKEKPDMAAIKKYIMVPNSSVMFEGHTISMKFFGDDGLSAASDFPAGYTVGWFMLSDGFDKSTNSIKPDAGLITTNDDDNQHFISLYSKKFNSLVFALEDGMDKHTDSKGNAYFGDGDYDDFLFCVIANPQSAIIDPENPDRPTIDDKEDITLPDQTETKTGTLAFEDVWPKGGDYDMNDVVVEYTRSITFDQNNQVKKVVNTYKPVHDGADFTNAFAVQMLDMGTVEVSQNVASVESATSSVILFENAKGVVKTADNYVVTRTFTGGYTKSDIKKDNPFIIVGYKSGVANRVEVHLAKYLPTSLADQSLNYSEDDAYYVDKNGKYPFAIDIPVLNFKVANETVRIDAEYPAFKTWAESMGTSAKDWYLKGKAAK